MGPVGRESLARGQSLEIAARLTAFAVVPTTTAVMGVRLDLGRVVPEQVHPLSSRLPEGRSRSRLLRERLAPLWFTKPPSSLRHRRQARQSSRKPSG